MLSSWIFILANGILSFVANRYVKIITIEINPLAISIIALYGGNVLINSFLLTFLYVFISLPEIFSLPPKFVMTAVAGYLAVATQGYVLPIIVYYIGVGAYLFFTGQFGPPAPMYLLVGLLENFILLKIILAVFI